MIIKMYVYDSETFELRKLVLACIPNIKLS